jgi:PepSY-associated TM region
MRALLLIHRYLGIIGGALMVSWCASGFVMMYVSYPKLTEAERLKTLEPIAWSACLESPNALPEDASTIFQIEMLAGRPVMREASALRDLCTGAPLAKVTPIDAGTVATARLGHAPQLSGLVDEDQWTVSGQFRAERPLYHFVAHDEAHSELYVSSVSGRLVQATTQRQRFWNWLGAIPHWLYVFELRRHPGPWSQVVVAASLLGCFLTLTGLYLGLRRLPVFSRRALHGARAWHHVSGVVFGLFTLSWVGSGLMTMQPWGLLDSSPLGQKPLRGRPPTKAQLQTALRALSTALEDSPFVSLESQPTDGTPFFIARRADGRAQRLDAAGHPAPLTERDWSALARRLGGGAATRLAHEDAYVFAHHDERVSLPVYRIVLADSARHALYFDAETGVLQAQVDANARAQRWVEGLHRVDLMPVLRRRPLWDFLVLTLLAGVSAVCVTGAWLAYRGLFVGKRKVRVPKGDVTRLASFVDRAP